MRTSRLSLLLLFIAPQALAAEPKAATLDVPSMYCSLCNISVRKALERVPGVAEATADNNAKRADVKYDPERVSPDDLAAALTKAGYPATVRKP